MRVASSVGVALIEAYQRHLSPRKGFRCAYGVLYDSGTCSSIGKQIMREGGIFSFLRLMPGQFSACKAAAVHLSAESEEERQRRNEEYLARRSRQFESRNNINVCDAIECSCDTLDCLSSSNLSTLDCAALDCAVLDFSTCSFDGIGACDLPDFGACDFSDV
jgi:putative component of membrane protein insertase Oxa1/YidC/SpoIIIJ protein YidD